MECVRAPHPDVVRSCGLVAFAYVALVGHACPWKRGVASLIVINGLLCHLTQMCSCQRLDVVANAIIIVLLNATSPDQPYLYSRRSPFFSSGDSVTDDQSVRGCTSLGCSVWERTFLRTRDVYIKVHPVAGRVCYRRT